MEFGTHCSLESCQQLDFLPFVCEACARVFCKEHCNPDQHQCSCYGRLTNPQTSDSVVASRSDVSNQFPCKRRGCGRLELVAIKCEHCHGNFCITHRHPDDHDCPHQPSTASSTNTAKRSLLQNASHKHKGMGRRSERCSQMVAMMRLKQTAKGPATVAQIHRVYYNVTLPNGDIKPLYFSKEWSVGKVIDHVAAMFKFTNNCHQAVAGPRLQLLSNDGNVFDTKLQLDSQQASGSDIQLVYQ